MYKIILAYDGSSFLGWQKTKMGPSIQEELEKAIYRITQESVLPEAASRTDRGVHAEGQVVQFALQKPMAPDRLQRALNAVLPADIRVRQASFLAFHPTLDAEGKEYHYHLCPGPVQDPIKRLYSWHFRYALDVEKMEKAAKELVGTQDFTAFANEPEKNPVCTIESIELKGALEMRIRGNRFLYKMARNIVGTLVYIGCGKLSSVREILDSKDRKKGGITAPAHGLCLHQVFYPLKCSHDYKK